MNKILKVLVALPAILFIVTGLRWLVAPAGVAPMFGLTLADGVGLSSQVGDMSAFFLTLGICMLVGLVTSGFTRRLCCSCSPLSVAFSPGWYMMPRWPWT